VAHTTIAVFGSSLSSPGDGRYEDGVECGRLLAVAGYAVVTGGYGGLMEAVSKGAHNAGGHVLGVTTPTVFSDRSGANGFVAEELKTEHLTERIHQMTNMSSGSIVLPGSLGTMTELGVAWNLAFVTRFSDSRPKPLVTVGSTWRDIVNHLGSRLDTDTGLISCVETAAEAVAEIERSVPVG
jgi:uncharacterized protein (TIGR00730 family)